MKKLTFRLEDELQRIMRDGRLDELEKLADIYAHLHSLHELEVLVANAPEGKVETPKPYVLRDFALALYAYDCLIPEPGTHETLRSATTYEHFVEEHRPLELLTEARDFLHHWLRIFEPDGSHI